jgi:thiosulfate dehydrogenase [quinone] large subunit
MGESFKDAGVIRSTRHHDMSQESVRTDVLGHESSIRYSPTWAGYALVATRLSLGWVLFDAGVGRITEPGWSAASIFLDVPPANPFADLFAILGHSLAWLLGPLIVWGMAVTGATLIFGAAVRVSAAIGAAIMGLFWLGSLPLSDAFLVNHHLVYAFVLFALATFGAGRVVGLDAYFEGHPAVRNRPWLRYLLG